MEHHNLFDQSQIEQIIRRLQQIENKLDVLISSLGQERRPAQPTSNHNTEVEPENSDDAPWVFGAEWADNPQAQEISALLFCVWGVSKEKQEMIRRASLEEAVENQIEACERVGKIASKYDRYKTYEALVNSCHLLEQAPACIKRAFFALIARDLIDETTDWNQATYDVLVAPLAKIIGKVHPDDKPIDLWYNNPRADQLNVLFDRIGRLTEQEIDLLDVNKKDTSNNARKANLWAGQYHGRNWVCMRAWHCASDKAYKAIKKIYPLKEEFFDEFDDVIFSITSAVSALLLRDLIDETTDWNQEAYDTLTGPWAKVIGPIHPDDKV